jgi:ribonuclease Z
MIHPRRSLRPLRCAPVGAVLLAGACTPAPAEPRPGPRPASAVNEGEAEVHVAAPTPPPATPTSAATAPGERRTRTILLGSGTPNPEPARSGPATAIVVDDAVYLVDFGPGVVRRAAAAGLAMPALDRAFVTHLHSDHTAGFADLLLTPWVLERARPLEVYGPPGIANMAGHIQAAYAEDVRIRVDGLEPANPTGWEVVAHEVVAGRIYADERVEVEAFAVPHGSWRHAFGYRFTTPDQVIVVAGDTRASEAVIDAARGADVLVHEVICAAGLATREPAWQAYHRAFHTTGPELGRIAAAAKPGRLVLTHVLLSGCTEDELLAEIRGEFAGDVRLGRDLDVY